MVKLVTKISRSVAGRVLEPGDEFEVDEGTARVLVQSGHADEAATQAKTERAAEAPKPKASTEVKPVSIQQAEQPQSGEYATRDLKAKA